MKNNSASELRVVISRIFNAPCPLVFQAWSEPKQMSQWWGPEGTELRSLQVDVKAGGAYRIHMTSEKGDHIAFGRYTEVVPNKRLQFTWQWESYAMPDSVVTVDFEDLGQATRLTLTHAGLPDQEDATDHNRGWTSLLDKFGRLIDDNEIKF